MSSDWSTVSASGLASFVEFIEALTIVLAAGTVRGWRPALFGAMAAAVVLVLMVLLAGPHVTALDVPVVKIVIGTLVLLFGLRWLRKAILRTAGVIALHDEDKRFLRKSAALRNGAISAGFDFSAAVTAFNGVLIEGIEVVFIVLAVGGASGRAHLVEASLGAAIAAVVVIVLGLIARKPLASIPENALKFAVGVLVSAFGTFWTGEGLSIAWPGESYALLLLSIAYGGLAAATVAIVRAAVTKGKEAATS